MIHLACSQMRRLVFMGLLAGSTGVVPSHGLAQITAYDGAPPRLTTRQAVNLAYERDPDIRLAKQRVERLQAEADGIEIWRDPQLRVEYDQNRLAGRSDAVRNDGSGELALRVYSPHLWSLPATRREARSRVVEQQLRVAEHKQAVAYRVTSLLLDIVYLEKRWILEGRLVQVHKALKERQSELLAAGESTTFQGIQQDLRYTQTVGERGRTLSEWMQRTATCYRLTGIQRQAGRPLIERSFSKIVEFPDLKKADFVDYALDRKPDILVEKSALSSAQFQFEAARKKTIPWFDYFQMSYQQGRLGSADDETWSLQAAFGLPVVTALQTRNRSAAAAAVRETEAVLQRQRAVVVNDVKESYARFRMALANYTTHRNAAEGLIKQMRQAKDEMTDSLGPEHVEVLRLREQLVERERSMLESEYTARRAALALRRAAGMLEEQ